MQSQQARKAAKNDFSMSWEAIPKSSKTFCSAEVRRIAASITPDGSESPFGFVVYSYHSSGEAFVL